MDKIAALVIAALFGCATPPALGSGREGEQYVSVVLAIVAVVLVAFAGSLTAGIAAGAMKARRNGESVLKGGALGVLKGLWYFLVVSAVTLAIGTFVGLLWVAYAFIAVRWIGNA